jgi:hypothetical protein
VLNCARRWWSRAPVIALRSPPSEQQLAVLISPSLWRKTFRRTHGAAPAQAYHLPPSLRVANLRWQSHTPEHADHLPPSLRSRLPATAETCTCGADLFNRDSFSHEIVLSRV